MKSNPVEGSVRTVHRQSPTIDKAEIRENTFPRNKKESVRKAFSVSCLSFRISCHFAFVTPNLHILFHPTPGHTHFKKKLTSKIKNEKAYNSIVTKLKNSLISYYKRIIYEPIRD